MKRWLFRITLALMLLPGVAHAASQNNAAKKLQEEAIFTHYLALEIDEAEAKLNEALELCGDGDCSKEVTANLYRDLGVVYVGGKQDIQEGTNYLVQALLTNPGVKLDPDLSSPELEAAFKEAKALAGGAAPADDEEEDDEEELDDSPIPFPSGDEGVEHMPAQEQTVNTPVPIFATVSADAQVVRVKYKPFGAIEWKTIAMRPHKDGFAIEIPCLDVTTTGDLMYYIEAVDARGQVVASGGTKTAAYRVPIRNMLEGEPPHLPGKPPPSQCADAMDCPPDFPGCDTGEEWDEEDDEEEDKGPAHWMSVAFQGEFVSLPATEAACGEGSEYVCFYSGGTEYIGQPSPTVYPSLEAGRVEGGFNQGTMRVMLGYDFAGLNHVRFGARVGFAFGGGPQQGSEGAAFVPLHGEARLSYWFRNNGETGVHPYLVVGGGIAQVDSVISVTIPTTLTPGDPNAQAYCAEGLASCTVDAWIKTGTTFAGGGLGAMFAITPTMGPLLEFKYLAMFGSSGSALAGQLGWALGF